MKRSLTVFAILALVAAPASWTQDASEDSNDVAGTIISDSPEALDFFLDWVSVSGRVRTAFSRFARDRPRAPQEMGPWMNAALRDLKIRGNTIVIPVEGLEQSVARAFAEQVFHAFYEGPFREFCMDQLAERAEELRSESEGMHLKWMTEIGGGDPKEIMGRLAEVREENFELRLNIAEIEARVEALRQRIESQGPEREAQLFGRLERANVLESEQEMITEELRRLVRQKEKLGTNDSSAIEAAQARLSQNEAVMAALQMQFMTAQARTGGGEEMAHLRAMLIEAEADYAGLAIRSKVMAQRQAELEERAKGAREVLEQVMRMEREMRQLEQLVERIEGRGIFGVRGIPKFQFR